MGINQPQSDIKKRQNNGEDITDFDVSGGLTLYSALDGRALQIVLICFLFRATVFF